MKQTQFITYLIMMIVAGASVLGFSVQHAFAAELFLQSSAQVAHIGQEFYVDVMLDPENESINAVQAQISVPSTISWVRFSDEGSIIGTWITRPGIRDGLVTFSGIIPNGFSGYIDPENQLQKKPARIARLVMRGESAGTGSVNIIGADAYINDGEGTRARTTSAPFAIRIDKTVSPTSLASTDKIAPEIMDAQIIKDPSLYHGHAAIVFNVRDTGSGIDRIEVREGLLPWRPATSPERLMTTFALFTVRIRAIDVAGNVSQVIVPIPDGMRVTALVDIGSIILVSLVICVILIKRKNRV